MTTSPSSSGRWFLTFIGIALIGIGSLFVWLLGRSYLRAKEMRSWPKATCLILESRVEERQHDPQSPTEFRHQITFGYLWKGMPRTSDHLTLRGSPWSSRNTQALESIHQFPAGSRQECWVNPQKPELAVLKPDSLAPGYTIWFPALFVVGGVGICIRAWRPVRPR